MKEDKEFLINKTKEDNRIKINLTLLGICFTLFTFLMAFNPNLLRNNLFLTLQLVCAIPLLMTSLLAKVKASYKTDKNKWTTLGFETYLLAYTFLINVVGIFLLSFISSLAGFVFFSVNILSAIIYSFIEISYNPYKKSERIFKDLTFILLLIFLGILPGLGIY